MGMMIKLGIKQKMIYKKAAMLQIVSSIIMVYILSCFWKAIYPNDLYMQQYMIQYAAMGEMLSAFYIIESKMSSDIRNGDIALRLLKPWNYIVAMFFENIGKMLANIVLVSIPTFVVCNFLIDFVKLNWFTYIEVFICILFAFVILFLIRMLVEMCCFWVTEAWSLVFLSDVIIRILSGSFIPSMLMPCWLSKIMTFLPFIWIYEMPLRILQNETMMNVGLKLKEVYFMQLFWIVFLICANMVVFTSGKKRLTVQGG